MRDRLGLAPWIIENIEAAIGVGLEDASRQLRSLVERLRDDYLFWEEEIFEQPGFPCLYFIEKSYSGDPTNWWIPNRACSEAMLRSAGFAIENNPEAEVYICRCAEAPTNGAQHPAVHRRERS